MRRSLAETLRVGWRPSAQWTLALLTPACLARAAGERPARVRRAERCDEHSDGGDSGKALVAGGLLTAFRS